MPILGKKSEKEFRKHFSAVIDFAQVMLSYHLEDSKNHFEHVKRYARLICVKYNELFPQKAFSDLQMQYICEGARLHDIGKISVPDNILRKKGPLTDQEYNEVKRHTVIGAQIIESMASICELDDEKLILKNICLYHHERYDGKGYPQGLIGNQIPIEAQIVSVAEVYDALTESNYKEAISHENAMLKIVSGECGTFNPDIIECLRDIESDLHVLSQLKTDCDRMELLDEFYSNRSHKNYWRFKRTWDVTLSSLALLVLSPLMALIALLIYVDDPKGSPIFKQTRLGRHKKPFTMYKFRTMVVNAEERKAELKKLNEKDGPAFKIANDPRITRVGKILRKTSLDELPQLINIIKGDMTIVGPRPPLPEEVEEYSRYHEMRLSVTPGLTCDWQAQPKRDEIGFERWVDMDVSYIGTRSFAKDLKIIWKTVKSMFNKSGS